MKLSAAFEASIALSFGDVSDAYQFFPSTLGISDNPDYRANLQHCRITDIDYKRNHAGVSDHVRTRPRHLGNGLAASQRQGDAERRRSGRFDPPLHARTGPSEACPGRQPGKALRVQLTGVRQ